VFRLRSDALNSCGALGYAWLQRPYGNVVLKKGVVGPDGNDLMP
jgi:hypothetical protein